MRQQDHITKVFAVGDYICMIRWMPPLYPFDGGDGVSLPKHMKVGHYNGYVSVPEKHPLHLATYSDNDDVSSIDVHGGITYSGPGCKGIPEFERASWWLGFDCGHLGDDLETCTEEFVARNCLAVVAALAERDHRENTVYIDENYEALCETCGKWSAVQGGDRINITIHTCDQDSRVPGQVTVSLVGAQNTRVGGIKTRKKRQQND
jgi:hypothetical protein